MNQHIFTPTDAGMCTHIYLGLLYIIAVRKFNVLYYKTRNIHLSLIYIQSPALQVALQLGGRYSISLCIGLYMQVMYKVP